jgi:hypothetical protein
MWRLRLKKEFVCEALGSPSPMDWDGARPCLTRITPADVRA